MADEPEERVKIFVGGINWSTTDQQFTDFFSAYGPLADSIIMRERYFSMSLRILILCCARVFRSFWTILLSFSDIFSLNLKNFFRSCFDCFHFLRDGKSRGFGFVTYYKRSIADTVLVINFWIERENKIKFIIEAIYAKGHTSGAWWTHTRHKTCGSSWADGPGSNYNLHTYKFIPHLSYCFYLLFIVTCWKSSASCTNSSFLSSLHQLIHG